LIPAVVESALTTTVISSVSTTRRRRHSRGTAQPNVSLSVKRNKVEADLAKTSMKSSVDPSHVFVQPIPPAVSLPSTTTLILTLPEDIVVGELRSRPSKRNRSPYVGDVWLEKEKREAIVHLPNLDMGGKCVPGAKLCMKPARDKKGNLIGKDATNPNYGTPKCEFIAQLLHVDESDLGYEPVWVGAHPSLGEKVAEEFVRLNLLGSDFPAVESFQREVRNVGGTDMRADFLIHHTDPKLPPRILEVKTVVDTDYASSAVPTNRTKCVFTNDHVPYVRTGIFPWGSCNQKGPDGEAVVSARAIKHIRELTRIVEDGQTQRYSATILFVVSRHDAKVFKPNDEACPSFAKYLKEARDAGVQILAKQVIWGDGESIGKCYEGDLLEIVWP
jgi:DNA-binding sugar fermentation-stimulating protein